MAAENNSRVSIALFSCRSPFPVSCCTSTQSTCPRVHIAQVCTSHLHELGLPAVDDADARMRWKRVFGAEFEALAGIQTQNYKALQGIETQQGAYKVIQTRL